MRPPFVMNRYDHGVGKCLRRLDRIIGVHRQVERPARLRRTGEEQNDAGLEPARDLGNAVVRDVLVTGRSINAAKALEVGLVSQVVAEGQAPRVARLVAQQVCKFDRETSRTAKRFVKPIPYAELRQEIELFCELFARPAVEAALKKFVESTGPLPYVP